MKLKCIQRPRSHMGHKESVLISGAMVLALLTSVGTGEAKAADATAVPAADRPVVDLRTWPTPNIDLSKLPNNEQNRLIKMGQALFTHTSEYLAPRCQTAQNATRVRTWRAVAAIVLRRRSRMQPR